jgi:transposase-like protein
VPSTRRALFDVLEVPRQLRVCGLVLTVGLRLDTEHIAITEPVRRLEVFTGVGRRRTWRDKDKARIVAEIATSGDSVCAVARRNGLSPQQLFGWRRQLRETDAGSSEAGGLQFVPTVVDVARLLFRNGGRRDAKPRPVPE